MHNNIDWHYFPPRCLLQVTFGSELIKSYRDVAARRKTDPLNDAELREQRLHGRPPHPSVNGSPAAWELVEETLNAILADSADANEEGFPSKTKLRDHVLTTLVERQIEMEEKDPRRFVPVRFTYVGTDEDQATASLWKGVVVGPVWFDCLTTARRLSCRRRDVYVGIVV